MKSKTKTSTYFSGIITVVILLLSAGCSVNTHHVSGFVKDIAGNPVSGVVVSDGYNCVLTDKRGKYILTRDSLARYIFISTPSGYEVSPQPGYGSMPGFYMPAYPAEGGSTAKYNPNFNLIPTEKDTKKFVIFAVGDPQSGNDEDIARFRDQTMPDIRDVRETYGTDTYAIGLALGDIVWKGTQESCFKQKTSLGEAGFTFLTTPGNHDKDAIDWTGDAYSAAFGPMWFSYNIGDVHIVSMDNINEFSSKEKGAKLTSTGFSDEQVRWLEKDLSFVPKEKKVLLIYHVPERNNKSHLNHDKVLSLISEYEKPVAMCGHTHYYQFFRNAEYGVDEYILGAACGYFWRSDVEADGVPNGYNVFEIDGTEITNAYFKGTDHPQNHQIRLYRGNEVFGGDRAKYSYGLGQGTIVANVFFGGMGGEWKIEVYEDGKLSGEMKKMPPSVPDFWAYGYHTGILTHSFTSAKAANHHQYNYTLKNPEAKVEVQATDPWGNIYKQDKFWSSSDLDEIDGSFRHTN